jgi:hypothetical protein
MMSLLWNGTVLYNNSASGQYYAASAAGHANNNNNSNIATLIQYISPYLYPFSIEYNILTGQSILYALPIQSFS